MTVTDSGFHQLMRDRHRGALTTLRRDGHPQLSTVDYNYDLDRSMARIFTTADRVKVVNLHRDPRASLYVTSERGQRVGGRRGHS